MILVNTLQAGVAREVFHATLNWLFVAAAHCSSTPFASRVMLVNLGGAAEFVSASPARTRKNWDWDGSGMQ